MRIRDSILFIFLLLTLGLAVAAQPDEKISFEATERFDPFGILGAPVGYYALPGTIFCPGNEPTGDPIFPCPEGSRTHSRGVRWVSRVISETPDIPDGWMTVDVNANLDPAFNGPHWGTFSLAYDDGGTLEGVWQGNRKKEGDQWVIVLNVSGKIAGGSYDGANVSLTDTIHSYLPVPYYYVGYIEGRIVNP